MPDIYNRVRIWVDPKFQARLLLRVGLYLAAYALVVLHIAFFFEFMWDKLGMAPQKAFLDAYADFFGRHAFILYGLVLIVPLVLADALKFSHRVAGPLHRCLKTMQDMTAGRPVSEFTPRKGDLMGHMSEAFNRLIQEWNMRLAQTAQRESAGHAEKPACSSRQPTGNEAVLAGDRDDLAIVAAGRLDGSWPAKQ